MRNLCFLRRILLWWGIACGGCSTVGTLFGAAPLSTTEIVRLLDEAERDFVPLPADRVAERRREFHDALAGVRRILDKCDDANCRGWNNFLQLDELEVALEQHPAWQRTAVEALRERMRTDEAGLEHPAMLALREAARRYAAALRLSEIDLKASLRAAAGDLRELIAAADPIPNRAQAERIGAILDLFIDAEQAPAVVAAVRSQWTYPNVIIQVSTPFLNRFVERDVEDASMQEATVLGTRSRGVSQTKAHLELVSLPDDERAHLQLRLVGTSRSPGNRGHNGPATILSSCFTEFEAVKDFYFHPVDGLRGMPADANCRSSLNVRHIDVDVPVLPVLTKPLATRMAWSQSREQHAQAEQAVSRMARERVKRRLDEAAEEAPNKLQSGFYRYLHQQPLRFDELPVLGSRSTLQYVQLLITQAGPAQLAAATSPPQLDDATIVGLTIHESYFSNDTLRGAVDVGNLSDEQIETVSQLLTGFVPPQLRVFSNSVPWSVTLDVNRPYTVIFDDGRIDLTMHTLAWTIGERRFVREIDLHVVYEVSNSRLGMTFTRVGDREILVGDERDWNDDERRVLLPHIVEKGGAIFPEFGRFNSLIFPKGEALGPLGMVELRQLSCDDGWLTIGYQLNEKARPTKGEQENIAAKASPAR